jgi:hypothetical protein
MIHRPLKGDSRRIRNGYPLSTPPVCFLTFSTMRPACGFERRSRKKDYFEATISQGPVERILYFFLAALQFARARCSAAAFEEELRSAPQ